MNDERRAYILVHSNTAATPEQMKEHLNSMSEVKTWRTDLSNSFYIISDSSAQILSKRLREKTGAKGRFIIAEVTPNSNGWLTPESWFLLRNKTHKPKREK
jgi:hypothetical protein